MLSAMPSAAFAPSLFFGLALLIAASPATAMQTTLVSDDFTTATDSLWHFQTATFRDGVLSPGKEADIPGVSPTSGQLNIDPVASVMRFTPRRLHNAYQSCFLAYRNDFRTDSVFASHVRVEIPDNLTDPTADDSLGGLHILIRYSNEMGEFGLARTVMKVKHAQTIDLDTCAFVYIRKGDWLASPVMNSDRRTLALSHIAGVGLFYISGISSPTSQSASTTLKVGGFRARGDLKWPEISGTPLDGKVTAGESLLLRWKFPPALTARFRWFRNEKPVPEAQGPAFLYSPTLDDVRVHVFRAEIKLPNGDMLQTGKIQVRVMKPVPPVIFQQSGDTTVPEGGDVIFKIKAKGTMPLAYQWYRNGKAISGATQTFYSFVPSTIYEGGQYHCVVTDRLGAKAQSRKVAMVVKSGPGKDGWLPQALTISGKAGVNNTDFYQDDKSLSTPSLYQWNFVQAGVQAVWQTHFSWSLQTDLLYIKKSVGYEYPDHASVVTFDYLECPLLLRIRLGKWMPRTPLNLLVGGYGAVLIKAENEEDWRVWKSTQPAEGFADWDYGPVMGMSWQIGIMALEWRYSLGLVDLREGASNGPVTLGALSGMIGFSLFTPQDAAR